MEDPSAVDVGIGLITGAREMVLFGILEETEDDCKREEEERRRTGGGEDCSCVSVEETCVSSNTVTEVGVWMILVVEGSMESAVGWRRHVQLLHWVLINNVPVVTRD